MRLHPPQGRSLGYETAEDLLRRLQGIALMRIGHSRRMVGPMHRDRELCLFPYVCESGFEHRRQTHHWIVAVCQAEHGCAGAVITAQDWLMAAAWYPTHRELPISKPDQSEAGCQSRVAIVDDPDEWNVRLQGGLRAWFAAQPLERSWDIIPGYVVGYQPGRAQDEIAAELAQSARELARRLME
jgi:hypothetical protein